MTEASHRSIYTEIQARDWWLVFEREAAYPEFRQRRGAPWWIRMWTSPEFRHVWALTPSTIGAGTITMQSLGTMLVIDWEPIDAEQAAKACAWSGHRVVKVAGQAKQCYFPGLSQCVTDAKRLLGIRAWWVWTPRQLWRYIHRRGLVQCSAESHCSPSR